MFGIRSWHFLALSCHLASKIQSQNQNARKGHQIISNSHVRPLASALHIGILKWLRLRRPHIPGANARETVQEKLRKLDKAMTRQRSWNWERLESLKSKSLDLGLLASVSKFGPSAPWLHCPPGSMPDTKVSRFTKSLFTLYGLASLPQAALVP